MDASAPTIPVVPALSPVAQQQRIESLDLLRGVAVLGILVMNIQSFSMIGAAYINPTAYGDLTGANYWVWFFSHVLADQKFMTIFSMLFGAGIVLMSERAEAAGRSAIGVHYRRMLWLILFGLLHAHLLWYGDILYTYGMCGLVAWWFRKLPPWALIVLGLVSVAVASGISLLFGLVVANVKPEDAHHLDGLMDSWSPAPALIDEEIAAYRGSWLEQMGTRVPTAIMFQTALFLMMVGWRAGGCMLIGMALYKLGVLNATRSVGFYLALVAVAALIGAPIIVYGVQRHEEAAWSMEYSFFLGSEFNYWGSLLVSLGWIGLVMLACKAWQGRAFLKPLAAVGQMAFTNYIMQTVICTMIFYGHGLGCFGKVERVGQIAIVAAVWALQLIISPLWLRHFRYGPLEWLWRSLTYMKQQQFRKPAFPDTAAEG